MATPALSFDCVKAFKNIREQSKKTSLKRKLIGATALIGTGMFGPHFSYDLAAILTHYRHIGSGIFFNGEEVLMQHFDEAERSRLADPQEPIERKIILVTQRIAGAYDHEFVQTGDYFPEVRLASDYFDINNPKRGICRDKCLVLSAMLDHLQIDSRIETASGSETQANGHAWIYLPSLDKIIDPTMAEFGYQLQDPTEYRQLLSEFGFKIDQPSQLDHLLEYVKHGYQR